MDRDKDETNVIDILFKVQDRGIPRRSNSINVIVNIIGINDNSPIFAVPERTLYIKEGVAKDNLYTAVVRTLRKDMACIQ